MLYSGVGVIVVPNSATKVQKKGFWLYAKADCTVTVTFADNSGPFTLWPLKAGQVLPIEILEVSQASAADTAYAVRPRG